MQELVTAPPEREATEMMRNANCVLMGRQRTRAHGDHSGGLHVRLRMAAICDLKTPFMVSFNGLSPDSSSDYSVLSGSSKASHMQSSWRSMDHKRDEVDSK